MNNRSRYEIVKKQIKRMAAIMGNLTKKKHEKSESGLEEITVEGPLTVDNSAEINRKVHESLRKGGLSLDLTKVTEYDIACAGILIQAAREARANTHKLLIIYNAQIDRSVRGLFNIQRLISPYVAKQETAQHPAASEVYNQ